MKCRALGISAGIALVVLSLASPAIAIDEADRLWLVGERAFGDGLYSASRRALERFVADYPKESRLSEAVLLLGKARLQAGDPEAALEAFKRAESMTPPPGRSQEARFWQGETFFRLKRYSEARGAYDDVLRNNAASPLAPDALYGRAWSDLELKHAETAVVGFRDLIAAFPEHPLAASATLQAARTLGELKKPSEALALLADFQTKYRSSPLVADAQFWSGWIKTTSGLDPQGGVEDLRAFLKAYPNHAQAAAARQQIPRALVRSNNRADLVQAYKSLMEQDPPTADALYNAAEVAKKLNRPQDREAAWKRLSADFADHSLTRKMALELGNDAFKQKSWKSAAAYASHAVKSDDAGVRSEAWLLVGESELKQKRFADAAKAFEAVGAVPEVDDTVRFRALAGLGLAREEQQSWKAALAAYEAVANRSPDATLRDWARERVTAVKARLAKAAPSASGAPAAGNGSTKPATNGAKPTTNGTKPVAKESR
jgi:TolA-binding protein